jgi:hypothetical protein
MNEVPTAVFVLWWTALVLTVLVIVPVTLRFLQRTWAAARTIHRYAVDTRVAAQGIAANVAAISALDEAVAAAPSAGPLSGARATRRDT